jgi:hypothetical protein
MKKSLIAILTAIVLCSMYGFIAMAETTSFSSKFIKQFKDCDKYEETITSTFEDKNFTTNRRIIGWRNGFCKYEETITSSTDQYVLRCSLNAIQVDELYNAMKSRSKEQEKYELDTFAEKTDPKTGKTKYEVIGTQTIKGDKAYIAWARIQNNPYFCKPTKTK